MGDRIRSIAGVGERLGLTISDARIGHNTRIGDAPELGVVSQVPVIMEIIRWVNPVAQGLNLYGWFDSY